VSRRLRTATISGAALLGAWALPAAATSDQTSGAPHVTLTSPAPGALIIGAQPAFGGAADPSLPGPVTVNIYTGSGTSGALLQRLTAAPSGGTWSAAPSGPLADGVYTVQATEADDASPPDVGTSAAATFRVWSGTATLTLSAPSAGPLATATPTFSGTGATPGGAAGSVTLAIYPGADTLSTPVRFVAGAVASDGTFDVRVTPALPDGQYTAIAAQGATGGDTVTLSPPVAMSVKVHPPALTVTTPRTGGNASQASLTFAGAAGNVYGDGPVVDLSLFGGPAVRGRPIGTSVVTRSGATWQTTWPTTLALGVYTLRAQQRDSAGHVASTAATFLVTPPSKVIGTSVAISRGGVVTAPISCFAQRGNCVGDVLIVTRASLTTVPAGPFGQLRVMFAHFTIPAGRTAVVSRRLGRFVYGALRNAGVQQVNVSVLVRVGSAPTVLYTAARFVRVGS
jgi:hypothetical protein